MSKKENKSGISKETVHSKMKIQKKRPTRLPA